MLRHEDSDAGVLRRDPDKVSRRVADVLKDVASLEILQAPGVPFIIPDQFASLPRLTGMGLLEASAYLRSFVSCL